MDDSVSFPPLTAGIKGFEAKSIRVDDLVTGTAGSLLSVLINLFLEGCLLAVMGLQSCLLYTSDAADE